MDLTIATLFILQHQASAFEYLYTELEHYGGSCFPRDSCAPTRADDADHLWGNYTCECGMHCIRYGTCCANSPHVGKMLHVEYRGEKCQKLSTFHESVVTVSKCSNRWIHGFHIRNKCEMSERSTEDPVAAVPATNLETLVTYKNYFCALCNYDSQDVFMWDIALQFATKESIPALSNVTEDYLRQNIIYSKERRSWGIIINDEFYKMKLQFKIPLSIGKYVKKCYPNMVTQCDSSHAYNYEMQYKCLSYYAPIKLQVKGKYGSKKYRNIHCAICNNVNVSRIDDVICNFYSDGRKTKPAFSFALLLDVNRDDGDIVGKKQVCGYSEKWDPFYKKCRSLVCAMPGYVIKDGVCAPS